MQLEMFDLEHVKAISRLVPLGRAWHAEPGPGLPGLLPLGAFVVTKCAAPTEFSSTNADSLFHSRVNTLSRLAWKTKIKMLFFWVILPQKYNHQLKIGCGNAETLTTITLFKCNFI